MLPRNNKPRTIVRKNEKSQRVRKQLIVSPQNVPANRKIKPEYRLGDYSVYTSSAGGSLAISHILNPQQLSDWSSWAALYASVKVMYFDVFLMPLSHSTGCSYTYADLQLAAVPTITSIRSQESDQYSNDQINAGLVRCKGFRTYGYKIRVPYTSNVENASIGLYFKWQPTGGPVQPLWFKIYTDAANCNAPASANIMWGIRVGYRYDLREQT